MNPLYYEFNKLLEQHDKERCASWVLDALATGRIDIYQLYLDVFSPSLTGIASGKHPQEIEIWEEHLRSAIVQTMIELCYPRVLEIAAKNRDSGYVVQGMKAVVCSLEEEQHIIGARMNADFLTIMGYEVYFIGANTSMEQIVKVMKYFKPALVALSVTNFFHLTRLQRTIDYIHANVEGSYKIAVGGYAVTNTPLVEQKVSPDYFINTFADLEKLLSDVKEEHT